MDDDNLVDHFYDTDDDNDGMPNQYEIDNGDYDGSGTKAPGWQNPFRHNGRYAILMSGNDAWDAGEEKLIYPKSNEEMPYYKAIRKLKTQLKNDYNYHPENVMALYYLQIIGYKTVWIPGVDPYEVPIYRSTSNINTWVDSFNKVKQRSSMNDLFIFCYCGHSGHSDNTYNPGDFYSQGTYNIANALYTSGNDLAKYKEQSGISTRKLGILLYGENEDDDFDLIRQYDGSYVEPLDGRIYYARSLLIFSGCYGGCSINYLCNNEKEEIGRRIIISSSEDDELSYGEKYLSWQPENKYNEFMEGYIRDGRFPFIDGTPSGFLIGMGTIDASKSIVDMFKHGSKSAMDQDMPWESISYPLLEDNEDNDWGGKYGHKWSDVKNQYNVYYGYDQPPPPWEDGWLAKRTYI